MNKAVSWTLGGSGYDAREAARDAARRQGKSLGEWLQGVIAEEAEEPVDHRRGPQSDNRIAALTTRLERMGTAAARGRRPQTDSRAAPRSDRDPSLARAFREDNANDEPARRESTIVGDAEARLDHAIEAMERTARRTERRTDDVLASLAELLATSERRRESERAGAATLAERLAAIDARLSERDQSPIKGSLARLEARLEQIGRRSKAEADVRFKALAQANDATAPMRRLEEKLNAVLEAVAAGPRSLTTEASSIAVAAAQSPGGTQQVELPLRRRRLGEAIADIGERQRLLDAAGITIAKDARRIGAGAVGDALADHLEGLRREIVPPTAGGRLDFDTLRSDIAAMAEQLRDLAPRRSVTAIETQISQLEARLGPARHEETSAAIDGLRADIRAIGGRIEAMARTATPIETTARLQSRLDAMQEDVARRPAPGADLSVLEDLVTELGRRIEAAQAPGAGQPAMAALQHQVGALASRLESTETGLGSLATIERSMTDLFAHLEETRSFAETAAARAAQEAVRAAVADKGFDRPAPRADVAVLKAMQEDADLRTRATLDVVHETLDKVVDRLAALETGLAGTRLGEARAPGHDAKPASRATRPLAADLALGAAEPLLDLRPNAAKRPTALQIRRENRANDAGASTSNFIAAARRAAHAAQTDPSVVAMRDDGAEGEHPGVAKVARAGLLARSRDYVASHKRPVLLALAAVLVVAATMALVQRLPIGSQGQEIAARGSSPRLASAAPAPEPPRFGATSPKPLPHTTPALAAQIPGSDPIATGSIPSLPAFAAGQTPVRAPAPPALPAGLVRMADSGDGAAEYTLATAYAEGRGAPRDFQRAAKLYAQAADKGIVPAQYRLGALYEKGLGVALDKARARSLYQKAADAGNPRAMHNLAVLLADGDGRPDYEGAATWFRKAAQYGVHDSQYNLAILLARGLGVDQSLMQSYQWFAIAAAQGDGDAASKRDEVGSKLSASELSVAKALAAAFHPRSADPAATDVDAPPGGWDGETSPVHLNSARSKIS